MPPRFDAESHTLDLAVADLIDAQLQRSIGFANRGGYERMWLGQAIHSRYQEEALGDDPTYRREVTLRHGFDHRGWRVRVNGRVDGLRTTEDGVQVVEEIKSVRRGARLAPATRELYARQAALYAWLLSRQEPEARIEVELILIEIGSDHIEREPVEVNLAHVDALVKRRINSLLRSHRQSEQARRTRREAGEALAFPYPEKRPGQQQILDSVEHAMAHGEHVLVQAPTGLGKTVASLTPALRWALAHDKRVFVLTAKTLQQDMAVDVLSLLNDEGSFRSLRLRAKAKMCANDQVLCHEEYCHYAKEYYAKLQESAVLHRLYEHHPTLLPDTIYEAARGVVVCPFEVSLELAHRVQVTVCDYNYAFEPYVALSEFHAEADLSDTVLVIDEIHNLVDRGRGYYSPQLSARALRRAGDEIVMGGMPIHHRIHQLCQSAAQVIEDAVADLAPFDEREDFAAETRLPEDELWQLRPRFDQAFVDYLEHRRETKTLTAEDRFVDQYFALLKFLNAMVHQGEAFSHFVERSGTDQRLRILCKDPSRFLGDVINRCHAVIGLSATLSPTSFYRDLLGFDRDRTVALDLPSPFAPEHRRIVIDTEVETIYRERPRNYPRIAKRLGHFADQVPGNCLALFPSYRFLAEVHERLASSTKRILVQARTDSDQERDEILHTLRSALLRDVLLLAVAGGVFAEGVDYPGEMLKAVAIVGPCLPALTLEQELLKQYYDERFERGFEYAFVVPGMTRVVQAAGRLIRRHDDTGVIALFDKRFLYPTYRQHLPSDWLPENGDGDHRALAGEPAEAARAFFTSPGRGG